LKQDSAKTFGLSTIRWQEKKVGDLCLNTESGDTRNDPKKLPDQFAKAFQNKVDRLRIQSEPKNNLLFNIETIQRPIMDASMNDFHNLRNKNWNLQAKNSRNSVTDGIDANFLKQVVWDEILLGLSVIFEKCGAVGRTLL
jgi:hypothetical protein